MAYKTCAYAKKAGDWCGSPALKSATLCYQHYRLCKRHQTLTVSRYGAVPREEPERQHRQEPTVQNQVQNHSSFGRQQNIQSILRAARFITRELSANRMKAGHARARLDALQMAALNLRSR